MSRSSPRSSVSDEGEAASDGSQEKSEETRRWSGTAHYLSSPAPGSVTSEAHVARHESEGVSEAEDQRGKKRLMLRLRGQTRPIPRKAKGEEAGAEPIEGTEELVATHQKNQHGKTSAGALGEGSSASPATTSTPPTRLRMPPFPTTGKIRDVLNWQKDCRRISKLLEEEEDPRNNLSTRRRPKDPTTTNSVQLPRDKDVLRHAARSIVRVSPITHDGSRRPQCTGIIVDCKEVNGSYHTFKVTCSKVVCKEGTKVYPLPKLSVCLPDKKTILDADLAYFNDHYDIAVLSLTLDIKLEVASLGNIPEYGQDVFILARNENSSLMDSHGKILCLEESDYMGRSYYMFLSCEVPKGGTGGAVIDRDGKFIGMAFHRSPHHAIISFPTVYLCFNMFLKFGNVARPILGLAVRTIALMGLSVQEDIYLDFDIARGLIVDAVSYESDAEKLWIQLGDVILSVDGCDDLTLPKLEDHLLSFGWRFLEDKSISTMNLELVVLNAIEGRSRTISLPLRFCDTSERVSLVYMPRNLMRS